LPKKVAAGERRERGSKKPKRSTKKKRKAMAQRVEAVLRMEVLRTGTHSKPKEGPEQLHPQR